MNISWISQELLRLQLNSSEVYIKGQWYIKDINIGVQRE